jgi:hypothetical protein
MKYKCNKCFKEFTQKSNFDVHMNRKKSCIKLIDDINRSSNINNTQITHNTTQHHTNATQITHTHLSDINIINNNNYNTNNTDEENIKINTKSSDVSVIKKNIICEYCKNVFSRKDALSRHIKLYCNVKKQLDNDNLSEIVLLRKKVKILEKKINENDTNQQKCITKIVNNGNIINNINNQITNNTIVNVVSFGDEDINKLTEEEKLKILKSNSKAFFDLVKFMHLNERLPEYNNILINNLRSDYCTVFDNNKLMICNKNQVMEDLITNRLSDLEQLLLKYKSEKKLSQRDITTLKCVIDFLKNGFDDEDIDGNIIKPDKDTLKKTKNFYKELIYLFYNYRELVTNTFNKISDNNETNNNLFLDV